MGYARRDFPSDTALVGTRSNSTFPRKTADIGSSFLQVFVSTKPLDMGWIVQP
jgi:hypothetical protein